MSDRPDRQPENREGQQAPPGAVLEQVRRQIQAHERHDNRQSLLARGVSFILRTGTSDSLAELKALYGQAKELEKSKDENDKKRLAEIEKQLAEKARGDRQALNWQDETGGYATGFLKTMGLFMKGRTGLGITAVSFGLDQVRPGDGLGLNAVDFALGAGKGILTRKVLGAANGWELGIATKAFTLGISSRVIDEALTRDTYVDSTKGGFSLSKALMSIDQKALDRTALVSDLAVFGGGHLLFGMGNRIGSGALGRSGFLGTAFTGTAFGIASGSSSEIIRQHQSGEAFDMSKVVRHALVQGLLDTVAAAPGGLQADPGLRSGLSSRFRSTFDWLKGGSRGVKVAPELGIVNPDPVIAKPAENKLESKAPVVAPVESKVAGKTQTPIEVKQEDAASVSDKRVPTRGTAVENPTKQRAAPEKRVEPQVINEIVQEPLVKPPDRSLLIRQGARPEVVAMLTDPQIKLVETMDEAVRALFLNDILRNPASSTEAIGKAIFDAERFFRQDLQGQLFDADREYRNLLQRLGTDSRKPLSREEFVRLDRVMDLYRSRLGMALDQIGRPEVPSGNGELATDARTVFRKKVSEILDKLDIGPINTLMGGNAQEMVVLKEMRDAIKRAGVGDDVRIVRLLGDHAADHCGFDFVLVDLNTGRMLPVDASERNKFDTKLPEIRMRTVVTVPDPTRADIAQLWEQLQRQQGIAAPTPMPSVPDMLKLRCDFVLQQLKKSPIRITDVRLLFDDLVDRQQFSRKISDADRQEVVASGARPRSFFQVAGGELVDPTFARLRTLSPGLSYSTAQGSRLSRALAVGPSYSTSGSSFEQTLDSRTAATLDTNARLIERQTDVIRRYIEDLRKLSKNINSALNSRTIRGELDAYADHTENGALAYFTGVSSSSPAVIARSIRDILGK